MTTRAGSGLATIDYTVVMPVVSIRFSDDPLHERLREAARRQNVGVSTLAERLSTRVSGQRRTRWWCFARAR